MKHLFLYLLFFFQISCSCQENKDTINSSSTINIKTFDVDHPLWDENYRRDYDVNDLYLMMEKDSLLRDTISMIIQSFKQEVNNHPCLSKDKKNELIETITFLVKSHENYIISVQEAELLSYNEGKNAGKHSLDFKLFSQKKFIEYLKYLTNAIYYSYLEPGVIDCE